MNLIEAFQERAAYHREAWMTDEHWFLACFVARVMGGFHHIIGGAFRPAGRGIRIVLLTGGFATFDSDRLTALVFAAHDHAVRVELCTGAPNRVGLMLHRREREGSLYNRHPTLDEAVSKWRERNPQDSDHD